MLLHTEVEFGENNGVWVSLPPNDDSPRPFFVAVIYCCTITHMITSQHNETAEEQVLLHHGTYTDGGQITLD